MAAVKEINTDGGGGGDDCSCLSVSQSQSQWERERGTVSAVSWTTEKLSRSALALTTIAQFIIGNMTLTHTHTHART